MSLHSLHDSLNTPTMNTLVQMVAWVETSFGVSNIVVSVNRTGHLFGSDTCVKVTNFSADDGMEIALFGFFSREVRAHVPCAHTVQSLAWPAFSAWNALRIRVGSLSHHHHHHHQHHHQQAAAPPPH
jgi:hypothetical protein